MSRGFPIPANKDSLFGFPSKPMRGDKSFPDGWNPDQIPNIVAYWDNGLPYMTSDGKYWYDRIGNRHMKSIGSVDPVFTSNFLNGLPAYVTNGSDQKFQTSRIDEISNSPGCTIWMVGQKYIFSQDDGTILNRYAVSQFTDGVSYNTISGSQYGYFSTGGIKSYAVFIFDGRGSSDSSRVITWFNGSQKSLSFNGRPMPFYTGGTLNVVAKLQNVAASTFAGNVCECGIISRAINPNEIFSLNTFLSKRYNL